MSTTSETGRDQAHRQDPVARDQDLGAAGSRLSTVPREDPPNLPALGVIGWARWFWRQLTSMRVALLLLLLLSLAAIPGSLVPQTGVDETRVADFRDQHEFLAPLYDKVGLFDVYSSVWFSAIYILLFVSLIGCIVPRTWQFVGQLRGRPPGAPRSLTRLPAYTTWRTETGPGPAREAALALLRERRFRAHLAGDAVAAEKGYLREAGNLAFHLALIVMLIAFAWGQLFKSEGNKLIVEGNGFSNTLSQYDDFKSGSLFDVADLEPFSFDVKSFTGTYERSGPNRGTPRTYETELVYREGAYGEERTTTVKVNKPLRIGDSKTHLVSHGYAPVVTVRDGDGEVVFKDAVPLLPLDSNVTSSGVVKVLDGYRNAEGEKEQLGFNAFFVPTFGGSRSGTMLSQFPALDYPVLALSAYHGDLKADSGIPQSVYQMDKSKMKEFKDPDGELFKEMLTPGETMTLPDGAGTVTFENDIREWAGFQMVQEPGGGWALGGALVAIAGLAGSLFIQRRRVWVRTTEGPDGVTVVEMAGLGRGESATVAEELGDLAGILYDRVPGAPAASGVSDAPGSERSAESSDVSGASDPPGVPDPQAVPAEGAEKP